MLKAKLSTHAHQLITATKKEPSSLTTLLGTLDTLIKASVVDMNSQAIDFWETIYTLRRTLNIVRNAWTNY